MLFARHSRIQCNKGPFTRRIKWGTNNQVNRSPDRLRLFPPSQGHAVHKAGSRTKAKITRNRHSLAHTIDKAA
jgi:hypothetical protein